jgi:hypothetical protein
MTDINQVQEHISTWVNNCLSIPHPELAGFPICPYSKKALLDNRVLIQWFDSSQLLNIITQLPQIWQDDFDMVILATDPETISYKTLTDLVMNANDTLSKVDLVALRDHPGSVIDIPRSAESTNGKYALVFLQRLSKLQEASEQLSKLGYYQHWTEEELEDSVNWRFRLLQNVLHGK